MLIDKAAQLAEQPGNGLHEVEGLRDHGWHQLVEPAALMGGDWSFLQAEPVPPRLPPAAARLDREGSRQVAQAVVARLRQPDPDG